MLVRSLKREPLAFSLKREPALLKGQIETAACFLLRAFCQEGFELRATPQMATIQFETGRTYCERCLNDVGQPGRVGRRKAALRPACSWLQYGKNGQRGGTRERLWVRVRRALRLPGAEELATALRRSSREIWRAPSSADYRKTALTAGLASLDGTRFASF